MAKNLSFQLLQATVFIQVNESGRCSLIIIMIRTMGSPSRKDYKRKTNEIVIPLSFSFFSLPSRDHSAYCFSQSQLIIHWSKQLHASLGDGCVVLHPFFHECFSSTQILHLQEWLRWTSFVTAVTGQVLLTYRKICLWSLDFPSNNKGAIQCVLFVSSSDQCHKGLIAVLEWFLSANSPLSVGLLVDDLLCLMVTSNVSSLFLLEEGSQSLQDTRREQTKEWKPTTSWNNVREMRLWSSWPWSLLCCSTKFWGKVEGFILIFP